MVVAADSLRNHVPISSLRASPRQSQSLPAHRALRRGWDPQWHRLCTPNRMNCRATVLRLATKGSALQSEGCWLPDWWGEAPADRTGVRVEVTQSPCRNTPSLGGVTRVTHCTCLRGSNTVCVCVCLSLRVCMRLCVSSPHTLACHTHDLRRLLKWVRFFF